jgi:hypothetical protein
MITEILLAQRQSLEALADQRFDRVLDAQRIALVDQAGGQAMPYVRLAFYLTEQQRASVTDDVTAIKAGHHFTGPYRGKGEGFLDTLRHRKRPLLFGANVFSTNSLCHTKRPFSTPW